ncbi:hypothetical protein N9878_01285 [bacterium]|nr:hypothetical protein [bacterium]
MTHYIARWQTYEFVPTSYGSTRKRKEMAQVVYASSEVEVGEMIKEMDAQAHFIEVAQTKPRRSGELSSDGM